jgi:hypothetical protein
MNLMNLARAAAIVLLPFAAACGSAVDDPTTAPDRVGNVTEAQGGGSTPKVDTIKVSKCFYDAPTGAMLIKAASSDPTATLSAYRPDGTYQGAVQNGGGSRYGGTVMGMIPSDPHAMTLVSSAGGTITVPTTPFQL